MAGGVLGEISAPYSAAEAWLYDRVIARAVIEMGERIAEELVADVPDDSKVLDVGCGGGHLVLDLARRRPRASVTGLDLSEEQLARARARADEAGVSARVTLVQGSALELPFDDGSFDIVTSVASIKHWPDQARGVRECVRVLAPGGRLFVFEADRGCRLSDARAFVDRWRLPRVLRVPALAMFRTWVAGQAIDLDDARELLAGVGLSNGDARRVPGTPALVFTGRKAGK